MVGFVTGSAMRWQVVRGYWLMLTGQVVGNGPLAVEDGVVAH
jgi:hypothetical protein